MRVAVVQRSCGQALADNRRCWTRAVGEAAAGGAELVVLPEAAMASFGPPGRDLTSTAEPLDGPFVGALHEAAATTGVTVVAGMFETAPVPGRVFNTVVAVGPGGPLGHYRKCHLFDALGWCESARVVAGDPDGLLTFELGGLVCGVMNCYDLRFPEVGRALVDRGADVLVEAAHFVAGPGKADTWRTLLRARAIENTVYVAAAAKPAPECTGCSMVVDPAGVVLAESDAGTEGLATAELGRQRLAEVRAALPVLTHRRYAVVPCPDAGRRQGEGKGRRWAG